MEDFFKYVNHTGPALKASDRFSTTVNIACDRCGRCVSNNYSKIA